ncbi:MAG: hypothetical protein IPN38_10495 [Flavobacteriales bacterium]|nr:hypothetical protein [Flavobacteriales bacterium]
MDCSATWCGPCWNLHQSGSLEQLHANYGPDGTDQIRALPYEADASTTLADLQGTYWRHARRLAHGHRIPCGERDHAR